MPQTNIKQSLIADIEKRVNDKILEPSNANLLTKLIQNADSDDEAIQISALGTMYKRTGLHFQAKLEPKYDDTIRYFKKNEELSFHTDDAKPTNKLIIGDNYEALQNLLIQYKGKIDVIYIDPPYGKDSMGEFAKTNYQNAITRDNLLSMLYLRLTLAKQLLSDDGVIFCSIDDKNQAYVKCLFDEVFGEENFINNFVWKKNSSGKTEIDKFTINTEFVLLYQKSNSCKLNNTYKPLSESSLKLYKFDDNDGRGKYQTVSLQKPASPGPETTYDYIDNNGKVWKCPPKGWRMVKSKIKELENDNRLILTGTTLRVKDYWNERENEGKRIDTLWTDLPENTAGTSLLSDLGLSFSNPKPIELIQRCLQINYKESTVLDFFAGSGTTGHAVLDLNKQDGGNRTFILCQLNEDLDKAATKTTGSALQVIKNQIELCNMIKRPHKLSEITAERLRRIMLASSLDGTSDFTWLKNNKVYGGNLDVYEIETVSNFESVNGKTPFDVIDETLYGKEKFKTVKEKIEWVCQNFDKTQKSCSVVEPVEITAGRLLRRFASRNDGNSAQLEN